MQLLRRIVAVFIFSTILPSGLFSQVIDTANAFDNLRYRLSKDKKVTIAYLGGSITQGQGASNRAVTSWRPLTTTWFKQNYPQATVTEIDASWGATGSDLGAFRCTRDVCSKRPDLVFVEFAVNDWQKTSANVQPYMDGIVRNIWRTLPNCVIVFVYTVHNNTISHYDKGTAPPAVLAQQAVADHYKVCTINIGKALWLAIKNGKGTLSSYTADGTHPTDAGYKVYADEIAGVLKRHLFTPDLPDGYIPVQLPDPLVENTVDNGVIHMADKLSFTGWTNKASGEVRFPNQIVCNKPGTKLVYTFKGTALGMYWVPNTDGGQMRWSIDNSNPVKMSAYAATSRGIFPVLTNKLKAGTHTLTMEVLSTKDGGSSGNYIRIGALFVDEDIDQGSTAAHNDKSRMHNPVCNFNIVPGCIRNFPDFLILKSSVTDYFSITRVALTGKTTECLFSGRLSSGLHQIKLEPKNSSGGMYVLRIKAAKNGQAALNIVSVK
ncbi:MAG: SGNH/GDSL hydrolase family protein [Chitinispirillaceae bacterium]|nr:SGNH/GDSL hydrolase family protein [Chitinispirillaceae bacterium]